MPAFTKFLRGAERQHQQAVATFAQVRGDKLLRVGANALRD